MISDGIPDGHPEFLGPYYLWRLPSDFPRARPGTRDGCAGRTRPGADTLLTTVVPGLVSPIGFYLRYGFSRRGRQMFDGEDVLEFPLLGQGARAPVADL